MAEERIEKLEKQLADKEQVNIYMSSLLDKIGNVQKTLDSLKDNNDNGIITENECNQKDAEISVVQTEQAPEQSENKEKIGNNNSVSYDYMKNVQEHSRNEEKEELNCNDNNSTGDSHGNENNDEKFKPSCGKGGYKMNGGTE